MGYNLVGHNQYLKALLGSVSYITFLKGEQIEIAKVCKYQLKLWPFGFREREGKTSVTNSNSVTWTL